MMIINTAYFAELNSKIPPLQQNEEGGEVCIANISPLERQKRLRIGVVAFMITLVLLGVLIVLDVNPMWRLLLFFMFWGAGVSYFEARDKTCIAYALNETRKMGEEEEKIEDAAELKQVRRQSSRLIVKAFFTALALTLIAFLLP